MILMQAALCLFLLVAAVSVIVVAVRTMLQHARDTAPVIAPISHDDPRVPKLIADGKLHRDRVTGQLLIYPSNDRLKAASKDARHKLAPVLVVVILTVIATATPFILGALAPFLSVAP